MPQDPAASSDRTDLEVKLSFLERFVEELSGVVAAQADQLDRYEKRLARLEHLAHSGEGDQEPLRPHDDPPPHY